MRKYITRYLWLLFFSFFVSCGSSTGSGTFPSFATIAVEITPSFTDSSALMTRNIPRKFLDHYSS